MLAGMDEWMEFWACNCWSISPSRRLRFSRKMFLRDVLDIDGNAAADDDVDNDDAFGANEKWLGSIFGFEPSYDIDGEGVTIPDHGQDLHSVISVPLVIADKELALESKLVKSGRGLLLPCLCGLSWQSFLEEDVVERRTLAIRSLTRFPCHDLNWFGMYLEQEFVIVSCISAAYNGEFKS